MRLPNNLLTFCSLILICLPTSEANAQQSKTSSAKLIANSEVDAFSVINRIINEEKQSLHLPKGKYRLSKTIEINLDTTGPISISGNGDATIIMDGAGPAFRFIGTHEGTAAPKTVKENVWENQRSPTVDGIEIVGNHPEANGIEATGTMQLTLTRIVLRKLHHGVHLVERNRNVLISNCHIYENSGVGIFYDHVNLHQSNIIGCHISYNKLGGIVNKGGDVRNIHIGTCDIEGNMGGPDSQPSANIELDCRGGSVAEVAIVGCTIQHDHLSPNSANIRYHGESLPRPFTEETRHGHMTIADNVLSDVQVNIELTNARSVAITGNTMWKGYAHNLVITGSESVVVTGNMLDRNPRYHYGDGADSNNSILLKDSTGITFSANHITDIDNELGAVVVENCQRVNITNCTILDCKPVGILLKNTNQSRVSGCLILGDDLQSKTQVVGGKDVFVQSGQ